MMTKNTKTIKIDDENQLAQFAKKFVQLLNGQEIIFLQGDLGAGKTTLTKYIGKSLNIKETIKSPTYTYILEYDGLIHMDLYRIMDDSLYEEIEEAISKPGLKIIEWPEKLEILDLSIFPDYILTIKIIKDNQREITIEKK